VEAVLRRPPTDLAEAANPFLLSGQEADPEAVAAPHSPIPLQSPRLGGQPMQTPPHVSLGTASPASPPGAASVRASAASAAWGGGGGMLLLPGGESAADIAAAVTGHTASRGALRLVLAHMWTPGASACLLI